MDENKEAIEYYKAIDKLNLDFDSTVALIKDIKSKYVENDVSLTDTIIETFYNNDDNFIYKYRDQNFKTLPFFNHLIFRRKYINKCFSKSKDIYNMVFNS